MLVVTAKRALSRVSTSEPFAEFIMWSLIRISPTALSHKKKL